MTGIGFQSFFAVAVVLGLVAGLAWLVRRGAFGALRGGSRAIAVETAVPLGERRSLIIVAVEGRRLLLGMTPGQISMVTELGPAPVTPVEPGTNTPSASSFEQLLVSRAKDMFSRRGQLRLKTEATEVRPQPDATYERSGDILQLAAQES